MDDGVGRERSDTSELLAPGLARRDGARARRIVERIVYDGAPAAAAVLVRTARLIPVSESGGLARHPDIDVDVAEQIGAILGRRWRNGCGIWLMQVLHAWERAGRERRLADRRTWAWLDAMAWEWLSSLGPMLEQALTSSSP